MASNKYLAELDMYTQHLSIEQNPVFNYTNHIDLTFIYGIVSDPLIWNLF